MKSSIYKCISVILISFTIMFQYACNEPQSVEQQTKNSSRLSLANLTGAIYTTDISCNTVNGNIYDHKGDVYLDGGPASSGSGLPEGYYYCKVTDPSGDVLLGTSVGSGNPTPIHVTSGEFDQCYQLMDIVWTGGQKGFANTPNSGGEYKVWVSSVSTFDPNQTKTDNFKVRDDIKPESAQLHVIKFYDANANGINDDGQPLTGWKVEIIETNIVFDYIWYTPVNLTVEPGNYTVTEFKPVETNWMPTTPVSVPITLVNNDEKTVEFGNLCLGAGGGLTLGFWSNKNGKALIDPGGIPMLSDNLNLCNADGSSFNPSTYAEFRNWLLSASATNMAYMLSAQLAAMELNVAYQKVIGTRIVYAPGVNTSGFITINDLMAAANQSLSDHPKTVESSEARTYQEALKNALDNANNNLTFVQPYNPLTCPYTFQ